MLTKLRIILVSLEHRKRRKDCISQLQLPATNTAYLVGFKGHRKLITIRGKSATVSCGIWQTGPRNLEKFATENCGPYLWAPTQVVFLNEAFTQQYRVLMLHFF